MKPRNDKENAKVDGGVTGAISGVVRCWILTAIRTEHAGNAHTTKDVRLEKMGTLTGSTWRAKAEGGDPRDLRAP